MVKFSDEDAKNYIKIFTLKSQEEINAIITEHEQAPHLRVLQKALADEVTTRVHSAEDLEWLSRHQIFCLENLQQMI